MLTRRSGAALPDLGRRAHRHEKSPLLSRRRCKLLIEYAKYSGLHRPGSRCWLGVWRATDRAVVIHLVLVEDFASEPVADAFVLPRTADSPDSVLRISSSADSKACFEAEECEHRAQWRSTVDLHLKPTIGKPLVQEVESSHMSTALAAIWTMKTEAAWRARGRNETVQD